MSLPALLVVELVLAGPLRGLAYGEETRVRMLASMLHMAQHAKLEQIPRTLAVVDSALTAIRLRYRRDCRSAIVKAIASGDAAAVALEIRRLVALDLRMQLDAARSRCEQGQQQCAMLLRRAALRYALLTGAVAKRDRARDGRIRTAFRQAYRAARGRSYFELPAPFDVRGVRTACAVIWREVAAAVGVRDKERSP